MDHTIDKIASYAAPFSFNDLTPGALRAVKRSLLDSIGCALGAYAAEPAKIARRVASGFSSVTPATIIGTSMKTSPDMAAFANGVMVRYLDFSDDYINKDGPHPSDNISAVMAMAEATHSGGRMLACGIALAYEVVCQLVDTANFRSRGWDYVTETSIGSALGAAKVLGLSQEQLYQAVSLAITPNIGLLQSRKGELSMWKGCAGPNAARNGVFAALMASAGLTGPNQAIEGICGLWKQVTGQFELGEFGGGGRPFKIESTFFKARPMMYTSLLPVETMLKLRDKIDLKKISAIKIFLDKFVYSGALDKEKWAPHTRETADHSVPYASVAALLDGEVTEETFTPERFKRPEAVDLMSKLTIEEDPEFTRQFPWTFNCRIEITETSGRKWVEHLQNPKGHPANPMSDAEIENKFTGLTEKVLSPQQVRETIDLVWHLEDVKDVATLLQTIVI